VQTKRHALRGIKSIDSVDGRAGHDLFCGGGRSSAKN